jgi:hypothetical protein
MIQHLFNTAGLTTFRGETPHSELTVEAWPDKETPDGDKIATPNVWPEAFAGETVCFVTTCKKAGKHHPAENETVGPKACELWDGLSEEELRREYEIRKVNDDPIPPLLEEYDSKK